jgi:hypothetical protein
MPNNNIRGRRAAGNQEGSEPSCDVVRPYHYFDVVRLRLTRPLSETELNYLRDNAQDARLNPGRYICGFIPDVLTVNVPKEPALQALAELPGAIVNYLEVARDLIVPEAEAKAFHQHFDTHFVQPWHGKHQTIIGANPSYSGQRRRGHWFAWYSDRPCKLTGEFGCFHLEGRYLGAQAVRRLGVHHPQDLLDFGHVAYWTENIHLYDVNSERLGRFDRNQRQGSRHRTPSISRFGSWTYNHDLAIGSTIFACLAQHPNQPGFSVQRFVDLYGRGPFLVPSTYSL